MNTKSKQPPQGTGLKKGLIIFSYPGRRFISDEDNQNFHVVYFRPASKSSGKRLRICENQVGQFRILKDGLCVFHSTDVFQDAGPVKMDEKF
jgi:hypothetical protein